MAKVRLKTHIFLSPSIQPKFWKCSRCTRSRKFCMLRFKTHS